MNSTIKQQWCSALKSGEYVQGSGRLKNEDNSFCCLGVLTDLAVKSNVGQWDVTNWSFNDETDYLAPNVIEWAGLEKCTNRFGDVQLIWHQMLEQYGYEREDYEDSLISLSGLNDDEVPFSVISELITEQLN